MQYQVSQHLQCKYCWPMSIYFHINHQLNNIIPIIVRVQIEQCGTDLRNVNGRHRFSYINFHLSPSLSLSPLFSICLSFAYRYFSFVCVFGEKKSEKETSIAFATVTCLCTSAWNWKVKHVKRMRRTEWIFLKSGEGSKRHLCRRQKAPSFVPDS